MSEKEKISDGKFVAFAYKLYDDMTGEVLFEARHDAPDMLIYGITQEIVPGLAEALKGLSEGDRFGVTLPPAAAFGDISPDNIVSLPRSIFERDGKLAEEVKVGATLPMMTQEGFRVQGRVLETGDQVRMDFNHPFAGKTVRFDGEVIEVRQATEEELNPKGCGGCGGGCGSCGEEGGCGDEGKCGCGGCS